LIRPWSKHQFGAPPFALVDQRYNSVRWHVVKAEERDIRMTVLGLHFMAMDFSSTTLPFEAIRGIWIVFMAYWLISALKRKRTKTRESFSQRLRYVLPLLLGSYLLFRWDGQYGWLNTRFVPDTLNTQWFGVFLTGAGIAIAIWARYHLGANWSGVVTLKEGHELIRTGPYRNIRHPIYTGILLALLGTAVALGEVRGLLAVALVWASFYFKARREESFLAKEFGASFADHQSHTGMFLPRLG
jgi:protein-S-isoprenylcysteine O-methyltransferase Ste14